MGAGMGWSGGAVCDFKISAGVHYFVTIHSQK